MPFGSAALQLSDASLHDAEQFPSAVFSGRHGSPACVEHAPDEQVSLPLQNAPSLHAAPLGSEAVQLSDASLQDSAQFESPSGPGQGLPACPVHAPEAHVSAPLQNNPSLQPVPLGSVALQLSDVSLHDAAQFESVVVSGRHGSPTCPVQAPLEQVSAPLQNKPSLHPDPFVSAAVQLSEASLHDSEQFESPSGPGHGLPACAVQAPDEQVSAPLQNNPSLQTVPFGSPAVQLSDASLHEPAQLESVVFSGRHGSPTCDEHVPPEHVSAPLQNRPSVHADPFGSAAVQLSAASLHDSEQLPSPSGPVHGLPVCPQVPPLHVSLPLQNNPSSQGSVLFWWRQVPDALQTSSVQTLLSLAHGVPAVALFEPQVPVPLHVLMVHELPSSLQAVPCTSKQLSSLSLHVSAQSAPPVHGSPA